MNGEPDRVASRVTESAVDDAVTILVCECVAAILWVPLDPLAHSTLRVRTIRKADDIQYEQNENRRYDYLLHIRVQILHWPKPTSHFHLKKFPFNHERAR